MVDSDIMNWQRLLEPAIQDFIAVHEKDEVAVLALKKPPQKDWPWLLILDQIKARQKARLKMPQWVKPDVILPAPFIIEQASSSATAYYKASLCAGDVFVDLTGGAGIDCAALSRNFQSGLCIEQDETAAALLTHNLPLMDASNVKVVRTRAEDFTAAMLDVDLVYLDPQRRDDARKGKYILKECSPDITALLPVLKKKTKRILLKTSPMLDIYETLQDLKCVESVHVIEWRGECREVLYMLNPQLTPDVDLIPINAAQIDDDGFPSLSFSFTRDQEAHALTEYALPNAYLFEPGPAFQKSGGFAALAEHYDVQKLHKHTHLYTSATPCPAFPGRQFQIEAILPVDKKGLPVTKANLTLRNFPGTAEELRKKLGLADGGESYLFACTLADERKALILTRKI